MRDLVIRLDADETAHWREPSTEQSWQPRAFYVARARNEWKTGLEIRIVDDRGTPMWIKYGDGSEVEWFDPQAR